jgi:hypothetical protein
MQSYHPVFSIIAAHALIPRPLLFRRPTAETAMVSIRLIFQAFWHYVNSRSRILFFSLKSKNVPGVLNDLSIRLIRAGGWRWADGPVCAHPQLSANPTPFFFFLFGGTKQ